MRAMIFGCGYVGQRVAATWLRGGHDVIALTRSAQRADALQKLGIQPRVGDICEPDTLIHLPDVDVVLYAVGFDRTSPRSHEEVTCDGLRNVLRVIRNRCQRFIFVSSTSVYGQSNGEWVDEDCPCDPVQAGGKLNLKAEELVRESFPADQNRSAIILRFAGIYGLGRLLSRIETLRAGLPIAGRGDAWLNLIHVDDAVTAVNACISHDGASTIYNVIDDQPVERRAYFELLAELVGAPVPTFDPLQASARGSGGINKRCSNRKLSDETGWKPGYATIATGLPASVKAASG